MTLEFFGKALDSLEGWPSKIGIIGGEPTLHPEFEKLCDIIRERLRGREVLLFTSGGVGFERHKVAIERTFSFVAYNDHTNPCKHQPITMASKDVVPDDGLRSWLIDNCWVQRIWCPTISPKGAFFCEVSYGIDHILDGPGGWPVEKGWWSRVPPYGEQIWACQMCGMAVPMKGECEGVVKMERISPSLFKAYEEHGLPGLGEDMSLMDSTQQTVGECQELAKDWTPGNYKPGTAPGGFK
jgi:hypothetical protein